MIRFHGTLVLLAIAAVASTAAAAPRYKVIVPPNLDQGGTGVAINSHGQAVGYSWLREGYRPTIYDGSLDYVDAGSGIPFGIDDSGRVIIQDHNGSHVSDGTTRTKLDFTANAISGNGIIAGQNHSVTGHHACVYDGTTVIDLGTLGGGFSFAHDVNASGHTTGISYTAGNERLVAYFHDGSVMREIGTLGGKELTPVAINDADLVVGNTSINGGPRGFLYDGSTIRDLGACVVSDINNRGQVLGMYEFENNLVAGIWTDAEGWVALELSEPVRGFFQVEAISDTGWIVGTSGSPSMVILQPIPEPSTIAIAALGVLGLTTIRRTKQR